MPSASDSSRSDSSSSDDQASSSVRSKRRSASEATEDTVLADPTGTPSLRTWETGAKVQTFETGDFVAKGQVVVKMGDGGVSENLRQMETTLASSSSSSMLGGILKDRQTLNFQAVVKDMVDAPPGDMPHGFMQMFTKGFAGTESMDWPKSFQAMANSVAMEAGADTVGSKKKKNKGSRKESYLEDLKAAKENRGFPAKHKLMNQMMEELTEEEKEEYKSDTRQIVQQV